MRYAITAILALTIGVIAGISIAELSRRANIKGAVSQDEELAVQFAAARQAFEREKSSSMLKDQVIADRNARIQQLESEQANSETTLRDMLAESKRQTRRIEELEAETTNSGAADELQVNSGPGKANRKFGSSRVPADAEENLRIVDGSFRGEHAIASGTLAVTQVRVSRDDADFGDLLFELRNDSGADKESVYLQVDVLNREGVLLESHTMLISNWPKGALRSASTYTENPDDIYELRINP